MLHWLRLFRLPNVFTALADILAGFAIVQRSFEPWPTLVLLLVASACLYTAGMVLNDVFDVEQDRKERPQRPIPSGKISLGTARMVGFGLLAIGLITGAVAGYLPASPAEYAWRSAVVAALVAVCVVLYDAVLKNTLVGPVFMGLCRFFNVLLGASIAGAEAVNADRAWTLYFTDGQLLVAGAVGVYVLGITIFARTEAGVSQQARLTQGLALIGFGIAMLLLLPKYLPQGDFRFAQDWIWPAVLLMLGFSVLRHGISAIMDPQPARVQAAVKFAILFIIPLDAMLTVYAAGPIYGLSVFILVVPAMALGRWVYST